MKASIPTHQQIKRALQIYEEVDRLQSELANLFGVKSADQVAELILGGRTIEDTPAKRRGRPPKTVVGGKRGRKKAEVPQTEEDSTPGKRRGRPPGSKVLAKKAKRTISVAHREAIAAAQKRRWAAARGES